MSREEPVTTHKEPALRAALLEGALKCLQEQGYARTTARAIVAASGANLGAIGYHYGSTERLLNKALLAGFERWYEELVAAIEQAAGETQPLVVLARELPRTFKRNRSLVRSFIEAVAQAEHSEEVREGLLECYTRGHAILAEVFGVDDPQGPTTRAVFSLLLAIFDGLLIQWLLDPKLTPTDEELAALASLLGPLLADGSVS
jgi:AcrR family transcriptional regulator